MENKLSKPVVPELLICEAKLVGPKYQNSMDPYIDPSDVDAAWYLHWV